MADPKKPFKLLSDAEFAALTTPEKMAYLKQAVEAQGVLNRQLAAAFGQFEPDKDDGK